MSDRAASSAPSSSSSLFSASTAASSATSTASSSRKRRSEIMVVPREQQQAQFQHPSTLLGSSSSHSNSQQNRRRLVVRIKRFHGVAKWTWNANDDVCGICQTAFEGAAPGIRFPGEDSPVVWGKCGHAFHLQCVSKWLNQPTSKNSCPICRQEWEFGQNPGIRND